MMLAKVQSLQEAVIHHSPGFFGPFVVVILGSNQPKSLEVFTTKSI